MDSSGTSWGHEFIAGGLGGMAGVISGHPLDTIRIRQQQPRHPFSSSAPASALGMVKNMIKTEGAQALYRGMSSPLATVAFQNAVAFQTYATLARLLSSESNSGPLPYTRVAMAGLGTGALQTLILTPVELIKIRLQIHRSLRGCVSQSPSALDTARRIFLTEGGTRGLYRGLNVTLIRDAPAHAVYFSSYEMLREVLQPGCRGNGGESVVTLLTAGGFAGALSWMVCYPVDVVKTRIQSQSGERYKGMMDCLRSSVREEGRGVLWRGLGTALARAYVVNGAIFSAYEMSLRVLRARGQEANKLLESAIKSEEAFLKGAEEATLP